MERLIAFIEKGAPFYAALARNRYLKAIRDGFISAMPIIIFSSIFLLIADVPAIWGYYWPDEVHTALMKPYDYSMGIFALVVAGTTAKAFTEAQNRTLPKNNQINFVSAMIAAIVGFLMVTSNPIAGTLDTGAVVSGFESGLMGSKGLLTAFLVAFVTGFVFKFCVGHNITIKLPDQVPPNISQTFKDIIPFSVCILAFWAFDLVFRSVAGIPFAQAVIDVFQPVFSAADGFVGLAIIYGAMALFWFVGVHGPSIVEPAVSAALLAGVESNFAAVQAGEHATNVLALGTQHFVACLGGTGATLVICLMFAFLARSKELKAVGVSSAVPVFFNVNEPFLFGAPMVLNPVFFLPFVLTPVLNVWLLKIFVDVLGMNGFVYTLPWTCPGPIGMILGLGMQPLAFVFVVAVLALDFVAYFPFFKMYDAQKCAEEAGAEALEAEPALAGATAAVATSAPVAAGNDYITETVSADAPAGAFADLDGKAVLVLCAGGGTSGLLANALAKASEERGIHLETAAGSYGAHTDIMPDFDLVVLAPQVAVNAAELKKDTDRLGIKSVACAGKEYIDLTRDGEKSLRFVHDILNERTPA